MPGVEEQTKAGISLWRYLSRYKKFIDYCLLKCIFFETGKSWLLDVDVHDYLRQLNILNTNNVTNTCEKKFVASLTRRFVLAKILIL